MSDRILTRQEAILLHLMRYIDVIPNEYTMPFAMTQDGIGIAAGMSRPYVATVVGILEDKGMVSWIATHPKGSRTRRRAYYLLPSGIERGKEIGDRLKVMGVSPDDVISRPGGPGTESPNVIRAMEELEKAKGALMSPDSDDPTRVRSAIEHASIAIGCLSREVV